MDDPSNAPMGQLAAHLDRGWDLVSKGDYSGAMLSAQKSLELDEGSPEGHYLLGFIYQAQGRAEEALEQYEHALELDEGYVDALLNSAEVMLHPVGDIDAALRRVQLAREWLEEEEGELDELVDAMLLEAEIHLLRGDAQSAKSVVRDLPEGPYDNPRLALSVGRARLDIGDVDDALPLIRAACELKPPIPDAFYFLALALEAIEDLTGALIAFLQSRELDAASPAPPWSIPLEQFEGRVQTALTTLPAEAAALIEGALVVVTDLPGAEMVADGVDPRVPVLLDAMPEPDEPPGVGRIFVYKRNIERMSPGVFELDNEVAQAILHELTATFGTTDPDEVDEVDEVGEADAPDDPEAP